MNRSTDRATRASPPALFHRTTEIGEAASHPFRTPRPTEAGDESRATMEIARASPSPLGAWVFLRTHVEVHDQIFDRLLEERELARFKGPGARQVYR